MSSVLFLATEWNEKQGGLNALNRDLAIHCGFHTRGRNKICCAVLSASAEEIAEAGRENVVLISLGQFGVIDFSEASLPQIAEVVRKPEFACRYVVGHDIFTGPMAVALASVLDCRSVVIIHTHYGAFKAAQDGGDATSSHEKEQIQATIIRAAYHVMGIGPTLTEYARTLSGISDRKRIRCYVPGLPYILPQEVSGSFPVITFGRYDERNKLVKQYPLCVEAFCEFVRRTEHQGDEKTLTVVGLSSDPIEFSRQKESIREATVRSEAGVNVSCRGFLPRNETWGHVRRSAVGMMLSWREGFGLAGWETIAAGVPLIMSKRSGVYRVISDNFDGLCGCFYGIRIRGDNFGNVNPADVEAVSERLRKLSRNSRIRSRAQYLRSHVLAQFGWHKRARAFLRQLDPEAFRVGPKEKRSRRGTGVNFIT